MTHSDLSRRGEWGYNRAMPRSSVSPWSLVRNASFLVVLAVADCTSSGGTPPAPSDSSVGSVFDGDNDSSAGTQARQDAPSETGGAPGAGGSGGSRLDVPGSGGADASNAIADISPRDSIFVDGEGVADHPIAQGSGGVPAGGSGGSTPSTGGTAGSGGRSGTGGAMLDGGGSGVGGSGGGSGEAGSTADAAWNCGVMMLSPSRVPTDVLLLLDRSGSMQYSLDEDCNCPSIGTGGSAGNTCSNTTNCTDRWTAIKSAVGQTITDNPQIHWGLKLFSSPTSSSCSVSSTPEVPIGASSGAAVQTLLDGTTPGNNTPTAAAIGAATAYLSTVSDGYSKAILLATDGEPNCGSGQPTTSDLPGTMDAIVAASNAGFPVYVIGIGPSVGNLDNMAAAGGTTSYYPATSPQQLSDAFGAVASRATTCAFVLAQALPDGSNAHVYVDKQLAPLDASNGWVWGGTTARIMLTGSYCDKLMAGQTPDVQILVGCPGTVPPPILQ
jgi:hypothetical protein